MRDPGATASLTRRLERLIQTNRTAQPAPDAETQCAVHDHLPETKFTTSVSALSAEVCRPPEAPCASGAPEIVPDPAAPGAPPRVLVLEPDALHRQVLARLVRNAGYAVDATGSPDEASATSRHVPYALVMVDCDDPAARGFELAAELRRRQNGGPRIAIVGVTANADEDHRKQRKAAGIDNYIAKPVLRENVVSVLARHAPAQNVLSTARYLALDRHRLQELDDAAGERPELLCGWIDMFLTGAVELLDRMRSAHEDGNTGALSNAARQLRSRSGQIGALRVQEICGIIAALGASGSMAGVEALLPEVSIALDRATRELRSLESDVRRGFRLAAAEAPTAPAAGRGPRTNRVLLAEGDPLIARFLLNSLKGAGFEVAHVFGGMAALEAVRAGSYGVVIVNLDVPELDGYSILSELRAPPATTPVMVISSRPQEQDILRAFELGADDYVMIPFNPLEVVARLRRLVKQGDHVV